MFEDIMVAVQGGTFMIGSKKQSPIHKVILSDFYISAYVVNQRKWAHLMGSNPSTIKGDDLPVTNVSWNDVQEFIQKLNAQTGKQYRLPTEAEWEYAAIGGNQSEGFKYAGGNVLDEVGWYCYNCVQLQPIGLKKPNELGLYDMTGNVWEWCSDWYADYPFSTQTNPKGPDTGSERVIRGGCTYTYSLEDYLITHRYNAPPKLSYANIGFRLVHDFETFKNP